MTSLDKMSIDDMYAWVPIGLCCFDARLRYVHVNQWLADVNRLSITAHVGREINLVVPTLAPQIVPQLREVLETGEPIPNWIVESGGADPSGNRYFRHSFHAIKSKKGAVKGVSCAVQDVTGMVHTQKDLRKRESRLRSVLDSSLDCIITIDRAGSIESVNRATLRLFGWHQSELIGQNVKILMPEPYRSEHDSYLRRYLQTGEANIIGIGREIVCQRKDGTTFPAELSVTEGKETDDYHVFTGTIHDITERKSAEAKLQQRERELAHIARVSTMGEMAASLAHELNQPLGAISNFASNSLHLIDTGNIQELRSDLQEIVAITSRCGEIIRRIRRYVKKREPNREIIDLAQPVGDVLAFIKRDAHFNRIDVRVELPETPIPVFGDSVQIEQVLLNVARNAIDSMVESKRKEKILTIKVAAAGQDGVEISVQDSGAGIPLSMLARVCEPFVSSKSDGLGMGLSICKTIIEAHNGSLEIISDQSWGTLVRITLPNSDEGTHGV